MSACDPLEALAGRRAALLAIKTRDFAAEYSAKHPDHEWPAESYAVIGFNGQPYPVLSAADYNARQRMFWSRHTPLGAYQLARMRAMRPVSGLAMADMLANAARCETAADAAVEAWSAAA